MPSFPHLFMCIRSSSVDLHVVFAVAVSGKKDKPLMEGIKEKEEPPQANDKTPSAPSTPQAPSPSSNPPSPHPHSSTDSFRRTRGQPWPKVPPNSHAISGSVRAAFGNLLAAVSQPIDVKPRGRADMLPQSISGSIEHNVTGRFLSALVPEVYFPSFSP